MKKIFFAFVLSLAGISAAAQVYKDPSAPISDRVEDLLSRMTLHEKVYQLSMHSLDAQKESEVGYGVCHSPFISMEAVADASNAAKRYARENTRLGIPPIQIAECLHGVLAYGATIFPQAIAQGSTWNPALIQQMGQAIAEEASSVGVDQALSPLFDLILDARYGRNEECYSEDPYLTGTMGCAFVKGMQGESSEKMARGTVMCTAKHFAAYSKPLAGINLAPVSAGEREMRSQHLVPFRMAVEDAGIASVMPSYSEIDGIPAHANRWLLTDVLRNEWGFKGYTFSDYASVVLLYTFQNVAADGRQAASMALNAGLDLEAASPENYIKLENLVNEGLVDVALVDNAVRRVLTAKFKAGVFDKPYVDKADIARHVHTPEHIELARKVAEESVILLQNENALLPLDISKLGSIAVVGPNADQVQFGDYCYTRDNQYGSTVLDGIKRWAADKVKVNYAKGCSISGLDRSGIAQAVKAAKKSDVTVAVLGGTSVILSGLGWGIGPGENEISDPFTCGEGYDLTDINPLGVQRELLKALKATGKPIILVLVHGRPWSISWEKENIPAIIEAWYPGECGGDVISDILFGKVNPSGRLNASIPQSAGHIPVLYNHKSSAKGINKEPGTPENAGRDYVFSSPDPLFPFGFGLSYTNFEYTDLKTDRKEFSSEGLSVSVNVRNIGDVTGKEVVQLYVRDVVSSVTTPVLELRRFEKIELKPGEVRQVKFTLLPKDLALWNASMQFVTEPGDFEIMIGRSSEDIVLKETVKYGVIDVCE